MINQTGAEPNFPPAADLENQIEPFLRDSSHWVQTHWLNILIAAGVAITVFFLLHMLRRWGVRLCQRGDGVANWYSILGRALGKTGHFFILMASLQLVVSYARTPAMLATTVAFLFTIAAVFQAAIWLREIIFGVIENRTLAEDYQGAALTNALGIIRLLVTVVLFAIALVVVLSNLGVNVTGLVAGLGVGGIAIGLAAQGIFADLFAALAILFDKPFRIGDAIAFNGSKGSVERIGLKSTRIRGPNGEERIIANKKLLDYEILNNSNRGYRRMTLMLRLAYATPAAKASRIPEIVREVVEAEKQIFNKAWFVDFAPGSINFEAEFDSPQANAAEAEEAKHRVALGILQRFESEGIPFFAPVQAPAVRE